MKDWLEFDTSRGSHYIWNSKIGLVLPSSTAMNKTVKEIMNNESLPKEEVIKNLSELGEEEVKFCYDLITKYNKINSIAPSPRYQDFSIEDIRISILKHGLGQLILNVTEDCNFRCKYCVFSGLYDSMRTHSKKYMDLSVAKKAIDYYFYLLNEGKRYNPIRSPSIGFYGGEPLLNFELIKECVEYIEDKYHPSKIIYSLTTNGSLLDKEKADWLMQHNFTLSVSLDGPEEEHNRRRIYKDGRGTFKDVINNIRYIMSTGYTKITSLPVYDWKSDLFRLEEFFLKEDIPRIAAFSQVDNGGKYYEQFSREDYLKHVKQLEQAKDYYYNNCTKPREDKSIFFHLFGDKTGKTIFNPIPLASPFPLVPFTGTCIPGKRIFVDVNGNLHICQVINYYFPIGSVDDGLSLEIISKRLSDYFQHTDKCPKCEVKRGCTLCYARLATSDKLSYTSEFCKGVEHATLRSLADAFEIAEINPEIAEGYEIFLQHTRKYY
ncbi:MAG: radical SAM protein [Candidatus Methanofastidiosa archaeon]|nr:radical SAM protein [Candidatus Methanofastidiosa archaeon]